MFFEKIWKLVLKFFYLWCIMYPGGECKMEEKKVLRINELAKLSKGNRIAGTSTYQYGYNALGQRISSSYTFMHGTGSSSAIAMGTLTSYNKTFRYDQSGRLIAESISCPNILCGFRMASLRFVW